MTVDFSVTGSSSSLDRLLTAPDRPFALVQRPGSAGPGQIDVLTGEVTEVKRIADIPLDTAASAGPTHDVLVLLPYRQIEERGFVCRDDSEPILAMRVEEQAVMSVEDVLAALPDRQISVADLGFDIDDDGYERVVREVLAEEIGEGAGANFVIHRCLRATIADYSPAVAATIFRRLLESEQGAYWTFLVHTGRRTFVGATPERHVSLAGGRVTMNPISGTYRYPPAGPTAAGVLDFLADTKETDELYMVVDEELKMMASVCDQGGRVIGPFLKEMGRLAHTEYLLEGTTTAFDVRDVLTATMFAPTVTGSPLENACRVIARHERTGRGYYSGVAALIGRDGAGRPTLDSSILIRVADIDAAGELRLGVGATLVRHSDPSSEAAETRAKAAAMLAAVGIADRATAPTPPAARPAAGALRYDPEIRGALRERNERAARFWFEPVPSRRQAVPGLAGRRVLVVDAEDTFTWMLAHQLGSLGVEVDVRPYHEIERPGAGVDFMVLGPGPGDPRDVSDPRIAALRRTARELLTGSTPFLAICLGHQVLASTLGMFLVRKASPSQGQQREIDLFGRRERVGFYNTFVARAPSNLVAVSRLGTTLLASRDAATGEVHALRGPGFASAQFHPESILTEHGPDILSDMLRWAQRPVHRRFALGSRKISR